MQFGERQHKKGGNPKETEPFLLPHQNRPPASDPPLFLIFSLLPQPAPQPPHTHLLLTAADHHIRRPAPSSPPADLPPDRPSHTLSLFCLTAAHHKTTPHLSADNTGASTTGHPNQPSSPKVQQHPLIPVIFPSQLLPSPAASSPRPKVGQSRSPSLSPLASRLSIVPNLFISINTEASSQQLQPPAFLPQPPELPLEEEGKNM